MVYVELGEYKGHPLIMLSKSKVKTSKWDRPFSFGLGKAQLILDSIEAIKTFVQTQGKSIGESTHVTETEDIGEPVDNVEFDEM